MLVMPFLNAKLRTHDALMLAFIVSSEVICYAASPFCNELWQFYIATGIGSLGYCKYSVVRSLMSKSFSLDEVGKVFSILAVVAALGPVAGNPIFRQLYNATIDTFPGAFFLLGSLLMLVAILSNVLIYTQRHKLAPDEEDEVEGEYSKKPMHEIKTIDGSLQTTDLWRYHKMLSIIKLDLNCGCISLLFKLCCIKRVIFMLSLLKNRSIVLNS